MGQLWRPIAENKYMYLHSHIHTHTHWYMCRQSNSCGVKVKILKKAPKSDFAAGASLATGKNAHECVAAMRLDAFVVTNEATNWRKRLATNAATNAHPCDTLLFLLTIFFVATVFSVAVVVVVAVSCKKYADFNAANKVALS